MDTLWRDMYRVDLSSSVVVIFAHGLTNRLFCMRWLHWSQRVFDMTWNPPNCGMLILSLQPADRTGQRYYRLTAESLAMLGLYSDAASSPEPDPDEPEVQGDLAESSPSNWVLPRYFPRGTLFRWLMGRGTPAVHQPAAQGGMWTGWARSWSG